MPLVSAVQPISSQRSSLPNCLQGRIFWYRHLVLSCFAFFAPFSVSAFMRITIGSIKVSGLLNGMSGQRVITVDNILLILSSQTEYVLRLGERVCWCTCIFLRCGPSTSSPPVNPRVAGRRPRNACRNARQSTASTTTSFL